MYAILSTYDVERLKKYAMEISFSEFLYWAFHGNTYTYYKDYRWDTWKYDVKKLLLNL